LDGVERTAAEKGKKMKTDHRKESQGTDSLIELAKLFKLLSPAAAESPAQPGAETPVCEPDGALRADTQDAPSAERTTPARKRGRKSWPGTEESKRLRAELDEIGLAFRLCKSGVNRPEGWMRAVRQAIGLPVVELARRMGVAESQVFRLEESEQEGRVRVATLRRAAEAMGCELVYALVPREGKLASLAATQRAEEEARREREAAQRKAREKEEWKSPEWAPRRETIRQECERLGIAAEIYGR
jgi:predicted DNA-binding mobile mystery protein A